jgi:hypothetical protein
MHKELKAKTRKMKADVKITRKSLVKKKDIVIKSSSSFDSEVSLPLSKEKLYSMLVPPPKNDQWFVRFMKAKQQVPNSTMSFSIFFPFFIHLLITFFYFFKLLELFKTARYDHLCT